MTTILFANTKGGSGKTTAAVVLAGELLAHGARVVLLEGDPNRPLTAWGAGRGAPVVETDPDMDSLAALRTLNEAAGEARLVVVHDAGPRSSDAWVAAANAWATFVIADPEGSANPWMGDIAALANLVIVPLGASALDARQIGRTVQLLQEARGEPAPYRLMLTRIGGLMTRDEREIREAMAAGGLPLLRTALLERAAYRGLFKLDAVVGELEPTRIGGLDAARRNAAELCGEILEILQTGGAEAQG